MAKTDLLGSVLVEALVRGAREDPQVTPSAKSTIERLKNAGDDDESLAIILATADTPVTPDVRARLLVLAVELNTQREDWGEVERLAERARHAVYRVKAKERDDLLGFVQRADALRLWYQNDRWKALRSFARLKRRRSGYFHNVAYTFIGLAQLERGELESSLRSLAQSVPPPDKADLVLKLRGYSRLLYDGLTEAGAVGSALEEYGRLLREGGTVRTGERKA